MSRTTSALTYRAGGNRHRPTWRPMDELFDTYGDSYMEACMRAYDFPAFDSIAADADPADPLPGDPFRANWGEWNSEVERAIFGDEPWEDLWYPQGSALSKSEAIKRGRRLRGTPDPVRRPKRKPTTVTIFDLIATAAPVGGTGGHE